MNEVTEVIEKNPYVLEGTGGLLSDVQNLDSVEPDFAAKSS